MKELPKTSEELGRKGQEVRETTRDLDLLRVDVDLVTMLFRLRGGIAPAEGRTEETADGEAKEDGA